MKTVRPLAGTACLVTFAVGAGCILETEKPESVSSTDRTATTDANPAPAPVGREIIREADATEIVKNPTQRRTSEYHRVRPGETLSAIAARYGTSAERLAQSNGLGDPDHLEAGQQLCLPKDGH